MSGLCVRRPITKRARGPAARAWATRLAAVASLALTGCPSSDAGDPADAGPATDADADATAATAAWKPVLEGLDGALLSIWGSTATDVWAVGGSLGNGFEPTVLRFDGATWRAEHPGGTETYWWVHGSGAGDVWLVGEKGRVTRWNGAALEEIPSGTTATLFGVFAIAPNDVWAVGGLPEQPDQPNDVVLHWDGTSFMPEALPAPTKSALFKVWGPSKDEIYVVGEAGVVWHRANGAWAREAQGLATGRLTTVFGCSADEIYAVGGRDLLVKKAGVWTRAPIDPLLVVNDLNGVSCAGPGTQARPWGRAVVAGGGSLKLRLVADGAGGDTWESDFGSTPFTDLHAAWVDPTGAFWAVGGAFNATPVSGAKRAGVVARFADDTVPSTLAK